MAAALSGCAAAVIPAVGAAGSVFEPAKDVFEDAWESHHQKGLVEISGKLSDDVRKKLTSALETRVAGYRPDDIASDIAATVSAALVGETAPKLWDGEAIQTVATVTELPDRNNRCVRAGWLARQTEAGGGQVSGDMTLCYGFDDGQWLQGAKNLGGVSGAFVTTKDGVERAAHTPETPGYPPPWRAGTPVYTL